MTLEGLTTVVGLVSTVVTTVAVVVAGVWTYFRFFKDRTYRPRLEIEVSGEWLVVAGLDLLRVLVTVKNVGASRVEVIQTGSGLEVAVPLPFRRPVHAVQWRRLSVFDLLLDHEWIEAGETVTDEVMLNVGPAPRGLQLTSRLTWSFNLTRKEIVVVTRAYVSPTGSPATSPETEPHRSGSEADHDHARAPTTAATAGAERRHP